MNVNVKITSQMVFVVGVVLLLVFAALVVMDSGSSGRRPSRPRHPWFGPGGMQRQPWLGPGGTRRRGRYTAEGFLDSSDATFTMFGVDWCPHCVSAKPKFEKLGPRVTSGEKSVSCKYVNPEKDKAAAAGYEIEGYPAFFLERGGQKLKYSGPRETQAFHDWVVANM